MPKTGMYVLTGVEPTAVAAAPFDVKVIDVYNDNAQFFTNAEVAQMGGGPGGGLLLGYFSIGEAETYRDYFNTIPPSIIGPENPSWQGNYAVAYWTPEWRAVATGYIDRMIAAGYDGIYFDVVDVYERAWSTANVPGGDAEAAMVSLVTYLSAYAKAKNPQFEIWVNNAEKLLVHDAYLNAIDGMYKENLFYKDDGSLESSTVTNWSLNLINRAIAAGKDVVAIEYVAGNAAKVADAQAKAAAAGVGVYTANLDLKGVNYSGVLPGQVVQPSGPVTLAGGSANDNLLGGTEADSLFGAAGADTLNGNAGNDTLNGGDGSDRLVGGLGNDFYITNVSTDVVVEAAGQGMDTVMTSAGTYTLSAEVEVLIATNTIAHTLNGNAIANRIVGNAGADTVSAGSGNDTIDGGAGIDSLSGGIGDDLIIVTAGDLTWEQLNAGTDTVQATTGTAYTLGANVEVLTLTGATLLNGTGNGLANTIIGNGNANRLLGAGGNDRLEGRGGNDTLDGQAGQDTLSGGAGADMFQFSTRTDTAVATPDRIADFAFAEGDRIGLSALDANQLVAGDQAFAYIGGGAFTGAAGQLRVVSSGTNTYTASGDTNGDRTADFAITIVSTTAPTAGWFIL
ncbi:endo alpha-1,4 polygalactosaminidase [Roseomonas sp. PWR1]|uniref:Endo alpha-1,4 polygalactosaminidase n=1 Tax=Roseomonas nitratireducens TaxID=2820810 RepID=A0ABS4AY08_9PROT|nr:endo alpha-1,4 polygalactosaminidase [Neoroseomonas nitratireducens]MBP0466265.1 endo alpha-1,4 polygalactosaminidase [Neoroseomonas nitratireducens]